VGESKTKYKEMMAHVGLQVKVSDSWSGRGLGGAKPSPKTPPFDLKTNMGRKDYVH
jgi:hypothetical protein